LQPLIKIYNFQPKIISLPEIIDREGNNWKMTAYEVIKKSLPSFIHIENGIISIFPTSKSAGKNIIKIDLTDTYYSTSSYKITIDIAKDGIGYLSN
jgi:hypothetical protein